MTDTNRKTLTEFLGECPHDFYYVEVKEDVFKWVCKVCGDFHNPLLPLPDNRTFDTPQDFFALKNKLVEKGMWEDFVKYVLLYHGRTAGTPLSFAELLSIHANMLIDPVRFGELVVAYCRGRIK